MCVCLCEFVCIEKNRRNLIFQVKKRFFVLKEKEIDDKYWDGEIASEEQLWQVGTSTKLYVIFFITGTSFGERNEIFLSIRWGDNLRQGSQGQVLVL
jgi:hypothetical protein